MAKVAGVGGVALVEDDEDGVLCLWWSSKVW